jgi:hypothetical protein
VFFTSQLDFKISLLHSNEGPGAYWHRNMECGKMDHILFNTAVSAIKIYVAFDDMRGYVWQS